MAMKPDIDKKAAQAVVLLDRQYLITERLVKTRTRVLKKFEKDVKAGKQSITNVLDVYNYVFALIDNLVRYQKIAAAIPLLNKKEKESRAFETALGDLKDARDQLQHINNDIENDYTGPLLGAIYWASGFTQYAISFNDIGRKRSSSGLVFDTHELKYVHEFCYVYNEKYYDLGKAIKGMRTFNKYIDSWCRVEIDGKPYDPKEHFVAGAMEFKIMKRTD